MNVSIKLPGNFQPTTSSAHVAQILLIFLLDTNKTALLVSSRGARIAKRSTRHFDSSVEILQSKNIANFKCSRHRELSLDPALGRAGLVRSGGRKGTLLWPRRSVPPGEFYLWVRNELFYQSLAPAQFCIVPQIVMGAHAYKHVKCHQTALILDLM